MRPQDITLLDFLTGPWTGDHYDLVFTPPRGGMLFGSLQVYAAGDRSVTKHWETFHVQEQGGRIHLQWVQNGRSLGEYSLVEAGRHSVVFETSTNPKERRLTFSTTAPGAQLDAAVEGESGGQPYRPTWTMRRPPG